MEELKTKNERGSIMKLSIKDLDEKLWERITDLLGKGVAGYLDKGMVGVAGGNDDDIQKLKDAGVIFEEVFEK